VLGLGVPAVDRSRQVSIGEALSMPISLVRRSAVIAPLVVAGLVAGCGTSGSPPPGAPSILPVATPSAAATAGVTPEASDSATDGPTPVPTARLSAPPEALLLGDALPGEPAVGDLGSYTWGDEGSDAPWIVSQPGVLAKPGTAVRITFIPDVAPPAWTVRWARIAGGGAGDVASAAEGSGAVEFAIPDTAGGWSLQLDARFGTGHGATWYWRVDVE
jgi:hypothetical protein